MRYNQKYKNGEIVIWQKKKDDIFKDCDPGPCRVIIERHLPCSRHVGSLYHVHRERDGKPGYAYSCELKGLS
jgi:hypothetical protein